MLDIDEVAAGQLLHANSTPDFTGSANTTVREKFRGQMLKMLFNDYDVLKNAKRMTSARSQSMKTSETREGFKTKSRCTFKGEMEMKLKNLTIFGFLSK